MYLCKCSCVELNTLFDREIKVCYVTQVLEQGNNIKMICTNYILEFRNRTSHVYCKYF